MMMMKSFMCETIKVLTAVCRGVLESFTKERGGVCVCVCH